MRSRPIGGRTAGGRNNWSMNQRLSQPDPDDAIWVRRALGTLEPDHREVLMLREYEQLSYQEIAELLRIPVNTVRSRLFRARMDLKHALSNVPVTGSEGPR